MADNWIQTRQLGYLSAVPPHIITKQAANESVDTKSLRQGHFHEKEKTPETQWKTFRSKTLFRLKMKIFVIFT